MIYNTGHYLHPLLPSSVGCINPWGLLYSPVIISNKMSISKFRSYVFGEKRAWGRLVSLWYFFILKSKPEFSTNGLIVSKLVATQTSLLSFRLTVKTVPDALKSKTPISVKEHPLEWFSRTFPVALKPRRWNWTSES